MRFLVDAQLPRSLRAWLIAQGHEAAHVAFVLGSRATDADIVGFAASDGRIIITKDADFRPGVITNGCQVVWLCCGNLGNLALQAWFAARWAATMSALEAGERFVEVR